MITSNIRRATISFAILVSALLLSASAAFGAGKPVVSGLGYIGSPTLNTFTPSGNINPNGAATTYIFEYGTTTKYGSSTSAVNVGGGTSSVPVSQIISSLPKTTYHVRISATNSFGTTLSNDIIVETAYWLGVKNQGVSFPTTYHSHGVFKFDFTSFNATIECEENGSGTIGNAGGAGDSVYSEFSNCTISGPSGECYVQPFNMYLNGAFHSTSSSLVGITTGGNECSWFKAMQLTSGPGFTVTAGKAAVNLPMTMTEQVFFGKNAVNVSGTSTWTLTGPYENKGFGVFYESYGYFP